MFELFHYPFMQRALVAGVLLAALLSYLGVFVMLKRMAFVSDCIAHASLAGVAAGVLLSLNPLVTALIASIIFAVLMFVLERKTNLSSDTAVGLIFTSGMALGVLLISFKQGYQPELMGFLFGNILMIRRFDLLLIVIFSLLITGLLVAKRRQMTLLSVDREMAYLAGINPDLYQLTTYIILAISVVLGIKMLGIILVSALLLIPVSIAKLVSRSFRHLILLSVALSEVIVLGGLFLSYLWNLPPGPVTVLIGTIIFFIVYFFRKS